MRADAGQPQSKRKCGAAPAARARLAQRPVCRRGSGRTSAPQVHFLPLCLFRSASPSSTPDPLELMELLCALLEQHRTNMPQSSPAPLAGVQSTFELGAGGSPLSATLSAASRLIVWEFCTELLRSGAPSSPTTPQADGAAQRCMGAARTASRERVLLPWDAE